MAEDAELLLRLLPLLLLWLSLLLLLLEDVLVVELLLSESSSLRLRLNALAVTYGRALGNAMYARCSTYMSIMLIVV